MNGYTESVFFGDRHECYMEGDLKGELVEKTDSSAKKTVTNEKEVSAEPMQIKRVEEEAEITPLLDVINSQVSSDASEVPVDFVSAASIMRPNLADWGICPEVDADGDITMIM